MSWYMYMVECSDHSFYTGITTDLNRRVREHNSNNQLGAKSLRYRRPVKLVYYESLKNQSDAAKRERSVKGWTRKYKLRLIEGFKSLKSLDNDFQGLP